MIYVRRFEIKAFCPSAHYSRFAYLQFCVNQTFVQRFLQWVLSSKLISVFPTQDKLSWQHCTDLTRLRRKLKQPLTNEG